MTPDYQTDKRMALKRQAIPLPDLTGKSVLDVGCDFGAWSFLALDNGASRVVGLDRGRKVHGQGVVDLAEMCRAKASTRFSPDRVDFQRIDLGKQWREFGRFDVVFLFSLYHHVFANCGDHSAVWFWLSRHVKPDGILLWENPVDDSDVVVRANVPDHLRAKYNRAEIFAAADKYFIAEPVGPALHEPTREVWRFIPRSQLFIEHRGTARKGSGGATKAFQYADNRRSKEVQDILGYFPQPGSLNVWCEWPFDWSSGYFRSQILDVVDRSKGIESHWDYKWCRLYPLTVDGHPAHAFRFESEYYNERFVELIAPVRLRDVLQSESVTLCN